MQGDPFLVGSQHALHFPKKILSPHAQLSYVRILKVTLPAIDN